MQAMKHMRARRNMLFVSGFMIDPTDFEIRETAKETRSNVPSCV